jgi:hypothetical protein
MEAVSVPGQISGDRIISDLLNRIRERLERGGDLRSVDAYAGYSAEVEFKELFSMYGTVFGSIVFAPQNQQVHSCFLSAELVLIDFLQL